MTIRVAELTQRTAVPAAPGEQTSFPKLVTEAILSSADPQRAAHYLNEFDKQHHELMSELASLPYGLAPLQTIASLSRFLADECLRHPEWLRSQADLDRTLDRTEYSSRLEAFLNENRSETAHALALFRRKELLRIAVRDGMQLGEVAELTAELSNLADAILSGALSIVSADVAGRYGEAYTDGERCAFSVIALGKLGGGELNYSSDIDLMFLYTGNGETAGPQRITNKEFHKKIANQLTNLLSTYTAAGTCYRVDLRLRPEGSLGEVAISLQGAKEYYSKRARDWELQMLIKARLAAGDVTLGQEFLDFVEPSIYSTTLDFSTIETMSDTRERISEKLARRRLRQSQLDVKLAPGGIRDIEFLVQCLQRLHGARDLTVRHVGTLGALSRLLQGDLLSESEHSRLADAYCFLRNLEHRLQLEDDRQTHVVPSDPMELEKLARRIPNWRAGVSRISTPAQLLQTLNAHLENVQTIYERIVHAQRPLSYTPSAVPQVLSPAAESNPGVHIRQQRGVSPGVLETIALVTPQLASMVRTRGFNGSELALASFAEALAREPYYAHLIEAQPRIAEFVFRILESSRFLSEQLVRSPDLLEEVRRVADNPMGRPAFEGLAAPLNDIQGLRRFFRREMFRILVGSVCLPEAVFPTLDRTSGLAEFVIARAYRIALEQALAHARIHAQQAKAFVEPGNQMMVIALGRLGMREFDLASDADLVFIIPDNEMPRQQFWTRVAEHIIEILGSYDANGAVLSIDSRLRPNGREGVLVQSETNYTEYFARHAEAWEGIAYMKARGVAGDLERATNFLTELQQVDWRRYGQSGRSRQDLRQMRMRLQREQGIATPMKAAEGGYYDADFILMYLRLKGAGMFFKCLNTPERIDIVEKMGHLERADAEFLMHATTYFRAVDHALRVVSGRPEERLPAVGHSEREMVAGLVQRWTQKATTAASIEDELQALRRRMRRLFDCVFQ